MKYRADIDGLRALAVLPVIAFHLGLPGLTGGFTGVDIFFVISGYLISGIIYQDTINNEFSYISFYKRRCLRILPPLIVMLFCTLIIGYKILLPHQVAELGKSSIATALFFSNFYFWSQTGYFDGPAEMKPLLHTWSLAVEEQFYIVFPIILFFTLKHIRIKPTFILIFLILVSFALSVYGVKYKPNLTFYLLPARAWELLLGGWLALSNFEEYLNNKSILCRNLLSSIGLALIFFGFFWLDSSKNFPSYNALYPCLGAFLIIASGKNSIIAKGLALKSVVYIGTISYCLYLWHWPIIVYTNLLFDLSTALKIMLVFTLTLLLAIFSRYVIEIPFRYKLKNVKSKFIINSSFIAIVITVIFSTYTAYISHDSSFSKEALRIAEYADYKNTKDYEYQYRYGKCFINGSVGSPEDYDMKFCLSLENSKKNYILIGDSHGAHLWRALSNAAGSHINMIQATESGCKPVMTQNIVNKCSIFMSYIYKEFLPHNKVDGVIVSGRWRNEDIKDLVKTIEYMKNFVNNIYVLGPTVEYNGVLPDILAYQINGRKNLTNKHRKTDIKIIDQTMNQILLANNIKYISIYNIICSEKKCLELTKDNVPIDFDYGHFTLSGANNVAEVIISIFKSDNFL
ncbi:acyltransferase family protein [Acerihabitans arboris]|uniref:Acyltransferase family protein n=1 Tax=Acerihabitans arboris TaxID=2691583 RepID=A0A845SC52_9GAMM|nr:acyltransferase family protein [Acerihabitans arboris]NDL62320.1 acyltransferase family protein [Acerihabitans arboris]